MFLWMFASRTSFDSVWRREASPQHMFILLRRRLSATLSYPDCAATASMSMPVVSAAPIFAASIARTAVPQPRSVTFAALKDDSCSSIDSIIMQVVW